MSLAFSIPDKGPNLGTGGDSEYVTSELANITINVKSNYFNPSVSYTQEVSSYRLAANGEDVETGIAAISDDSELNVTITTNQPRGIGISANGLALTIGGGAGGWQSYQNLPAELTGIYTTLNINSSDANTITLSDDCIVYMIRQSSWNGISDNWSSGWGSAQNSTSLITGTTAYYYQQTISAGTYTVDDNSAMYMFKKANVLAAIPQGYDSDFSPASISWGLPDSDSAPDIKKLSTIFFTIKDDTIKYEENLLTAPGSGSSSDPESWS